MELPAAVPVKTVLELRAEGGNRAAIESWIREFLDSASRTGALQGSSVLTEGARYLVLLRFASQEENDRWGASPEVVALRKRGEAFVAPRPPVARTGLETWFALPESTEASHAPPRWKMALVTWGALVPQIHLLSLVLPAALPPIANVAVTTAITVAALTWFLMPRLTRLLARWLYPREAPR